MRAYVIALFDHPGSWEVSGRCIDTGREHGVEVARMAAWEPRDEPEGQMVLRGWTTTGFDRDERYSRREPCMAAFLSHASLWARCRDERASLVVLEHDAVFVAPLPDLSGVTHGCNLGKPSFGEFVTPPGGLGPFVSKAGGYLGGAHAYFITPAGAADLLRKAEVEAEPTDLFINRARFPWLQEFHPWPVVCDDSFSTIQHEEGCKAKHNAVESI